MEILARVLWLLILEFLATASLLSLVVFAVMVVAFGR